jgi:hypothetical protein
MVLKKRWMLTDPVEERQRECIWKIMHQFRSWKVERVRQEPILSCPGVVLVLLKKWLDKSM